ncbi:PhzF family phenazine biosynthesis protein [Natranaerobius trueperi]|uniref:Uncharacterized protein n=1 Tax=Natranaerobius trueperi TaxID=759412 RepID=A0A226C069_9FIRM|nr:hypothetical protein CDO51_02080 [Natranaerobius trueperi]
MFGGNPARVVFSDKKLSEDIMCKIAREVNAPETAFVFLTYISVFLLLKKKYPTVVMQL